MKTQESLLTDASPSRLQLKIGGMALLVLAGLYLLWYQGRYLPLILGG